MRFRRTLTALLSVALLGLPALVATAGTATATDYNYTSSVTLQDPGLRIHGGNLTLSGQVIVDDGAGDAAYLTGATVVLSRRWAGSDTWQELGSTTTSSLDGVYAFTQTADKNADYKVAYAGETLPNGTDNLIIGGSETSRRVRVMRDLNAQDIKRANRIYLKGNVDPGWGGKVIWLQRKTCKSCAWKGYDKQRTSSSGYWKFATPAPRRGYWYYRARVAGTTDFVTSYSGVLRTWTI